MSLQKLLNRNKKCDDNTDTTAADADRQHDPYVSAMLYRVAQKECIHNEIPVRIEKFYYTIKIFLFLLIPYLNIFIILNMSGWVLVGVDVCDGGGGRGW